MEFKSEYYTSWEDYCKANNVEKELEEIVKSTVQTYEENVFDFTMWLVM